ncbi:hypothetical protein Tco_1203847 [Tanacetum coccineum]
MPDEPKTGGHHVLSEGIDRRNWVSVAVYAGGTQNQRTPYPSGRHRPRELETRLNTPQNLRRSYFSLEVREITLTNWRHPRGPNLIYRSSKMAGPSEGGGPEGQDDREVTPPPLTKEQIEGHFSALRSLIKHRNRKNKTYPIQLDFDEEDTAVKDTRIVKGNEVVDDDLRKPLKEALKTPLTRRIIEFVGL